MSQRLPEGWTPTKGVSCAGWDITAAFNLSRPAGGPFAILRRRISEQDQLEIGRVYGTATEVEVAIERIKRTLLAGQYGFNELFPDEQITRHPNYGTF